MTNSVTKLANGGGVANVGVANVSLFPSPSAVSADVGGGNAVVTTRRSKSLRRGEMEGLGGRPPPIHFRDKRFT